MKSRSFVSLRFDAKKKTTRRERSQDEMEGVAPWVALPALIERNYPTEGWPVRPLKCFADVGSPWANI
jgi:IS5 family transposase